MASFTVSRTALSSALSKSASVCKDRSPKPILSNVLLSVSDGRLSIAGTDLERYVKTEIECEGDNCDLTVNAARLSAIVRAATDETMKFTPTASGVEIACGRARWNVQTEKAQDFPLMPTLDDAVSFSLACNTLAGGIKRVLLAAEREEASKYTLKAIKIEGGSNKLSFVATDSRRLAACELSQQPCVFESLLPVAGASCIQRNLPDRGECSVTIDRTWFQVNTDDDVSICIRQGEGRFPRWRDAIPDKNGEYLDVLVEPFLQAATQASITINEQSCGATVKLADGEISIASSLQEVGETLASFPVSYDGKPTSVKLNVKYLAELLRSIEEESVELHIFKNDKAMFVWGDCRHIIMGMIDKD